MPKGNTQNLKPFPKIAPEGSAPKSVAVRVPASQYDSWMAIPAKERNDCLRKAIADKLAEKEATFTV